MAEVRPGVVRMGMIKRLESLTPEQFRSHWSGPHGTIAAQIPNLRKYHQNHVVESYRLGEWQDRWSLDGLSELWFDDIPTMLKSIASPGYAPLARDTPTVMTMPGLIAGVQEQEPGDELAGDEVKAMLLFGRRASVDGETFAAAWRMTSPQLRELQGVRRIVNTYVNHWESEPARTISYEGLPVDIVCELWFATPPARREALGGSIYPRLGANLAGLVANASCYAMQTHVIVP